MNNPITLMDYDADWFIKGAHIHPRPHEGSLTREQVIGFFGSLGVDGVELMHNYWEDASTTHIRHVLGDAGIAIYTYMFFHDIAWPREKRGKEIDQARRLLDRTAEVGARRTFFVPVVVKPDYSLQDQRNWLIEGLRELAEYARTLDLVMMSENIDYPPTRPLMGRAADCAAICRAVSHPNFRLIYDSVAPLFNEEDPLESLAIMAEYIVHAHVKNARPVIPGEPAARVLESTNGTPYTGALLDGGVVKQPLVLKALSK